MIRTLIFLFFTFAFSSLAKAQKPEFQTDKIAFNESQSYANKSALKETQSAAETDFIYTKMEWDIDPAVRYISGKVSTSFKSKKADLNLVYFDLSSALKVDSVVQNTQKIDFLHETDLLSVSLFTALNVDEIDSVCIYYKGVPPQSGFGSFAQSTHGANQTPILWTLSEPYGAKEWWPCKQSLSDKIDSIDVLVTTPEEYRTASNGVLVSEVTARGKRSMHWKHNYPITPYLVAIAVTDYVDYSEYATLESGDSVQILNYVYPEDLENAKTKTPVTAELIQLYNSLIGEYPFASEKYGHAQFGWGGGMEHQTMSFMNNFGFELIAHELAHQWFGDYITLGSWQHIWLNEGFATYVTGLAYENLLDGEYWPLWKSVYKDKVLSQPDGSVFVEDTTSISRLFSSRLSYAKGGFLLHMQRWIVGDEAFFKALTSYFADEKIANGFALTEDWIIHIEAEGDTTLTEFFNDWFYGEGYPIYSIHYRQNGFDSLFIELAQSTSHSSVDFFEMPVPIRVYGNNKTDSADFRLAHTSNHQQFVLSPGFKVDEIKIDPENRILCMTDQIVNAPFRFVQNELQIYPNPSHSRVTIRIPATEKLEQIRLISINGDCIRYYSGNTKEIDLNDLANGTYFLQIKTGNSVYNKKIVKQ
ncbi:M1 family aminopeptidase [uncultured Draconibacterium sp.]|uniref:M1 family aminopeptidase n=1 Tax=uncultured Draconibacterium sp. TaxID=1573823 RepID=UPI0032170060